MRIPPRFRAPFRAGPAQGRAWSRPTAARHPAERRVSFGHWLLIMGARLPRRAATAARPLLHRQSRWLTQRVHRLRRRWLVLASILPVVLLAGLLAWSRVSVQVAVTGALKRATSDVALRVQAWQLRGVPQSVRARVDLSLPVRAISPRIYGGAGLTPQQLQRLGLRTNRWGGNAASRYNWVLGNTWNAARDWEFRDGNYGNNRVDDRQPSGVADRFIATTLALGAEPLITIPALGWVAKDDDNNTRSLNVPAQGAPPLGLGALSDAIPGYDPRENRQRTSIASQARKGAPFDDPPSRLLDVVYQDEWVNHLVRRFGDAASGGVRYYIVDNEPDLWSETHTDVRPAQQSYDEMLRTYLEYAEAIKDVDPLAQVRGPAVSGWTGIEYSALDRWYDGFRRHVDRRAHGDQPFLDWWLDQVRQHDIRVGRRSLDVLDVHYYPQGDGIYFPGNTDPDTNARRLRSTRSLWDPTYTDESWIREPVQLIPRLRDMINRYYPDTKLAIGEWNWGADTTLNGALAVADVLGIYGREGVDMAEYWTSPPLDSPGAAAFRLFLDVDGKGGYFGDGSLRAESTAPNDVAVYGGLDSVAQSYSVLLINKRAGYDFPTTLALDALPAGAQAQLYRLGPAAPNGIQALGPVDVSGGVVSLTLPSETATLLRITR